MHFRHYKQVALISFTLRPKASTPVVSGSQKQINKQENKQHSSYLPKVEIIWDHPGDSYLHTALEI